MIRMPTSMRYWLFALCVLLAAFKQAAGQEQNYTIDLQRGRLWHAFYFSQECEPMADWTRKTYGLDWPGFSTEEIKQNIGGSNSYLLSGGFFITALNDTGAVWGWDNFSNHGTDVGWKGDAFRYLVKRHQLRWQEGENYWLARDPHEAEVVLETEFEMNGAWYQPWDNQNLPVNVKRLVRQWSGSRADEDYLIIEYTITNTQRRKPLRGVWLLFSYALSPNHRGWNLTFPNAPAGAKNARSIWDPAQKLLTCWAGDLAATPGTDESWDFFEHYIYDPVTNRNRIEPEFVAPGVLGIKFLSISPDSNGVADRISDFVWSAAPATNDHAAPFLGVTGLDAKYDAMANPLLLSEAFKDPADSRMGASRLYANFSLGPFNIAARDSIKIVMAEFVGGMPYERALQPDVTRAMVQAAADSASAYLNARIAFNHAHDYTVPMPPPAPPFTVSSYREPSRVGNVITFDHRSESVPDPHQKVVDIAGYRIYRSGRYPFGPWQQIADIPAGDSRFYDAGTGRYTFIDQGVPLGYGFYYSVTAYDAGHAAWSEDASVAVPPLESSIFANRSSAPFYTTLTPTEKALGGVTVVPNPFYRSSGFELAGDTKLIQFVNLSSACTIEIYTVRGDLVKTIRHADSQSGVATWNQISDYGQYVKSGMYFFKVYNAQGEVTTGKFAIVN